MKQEPKTERKRLSNFDFAASFKQLNVATRYSLNEDAINQQSSKVKDIYQFPANMERAEIHRKVSKYGYRPSASEELKQRKCKCCGLSINIQQISMCSNLTPVKEGEAQQLTDFQQISSNTDLFFHFIKISIFYLLLRLLLCSACKLLANSKSTFCEQNPQQCTFKGLFILSIWSETRFLNQQLLQIESFMNLTFIIIGILFCIYYRCTQYSLYANLHSQTYNQNDFTIMVEKIPFLPFLQQQSLTGIEKTPPYYDLLRFSLEQFNPEEILHTNNPNIIITEALKLYFNKQANRWRTKIEQRGFNNPESLNPFELAFFDKIKMINADSLINPVKSVNLCFDLGDLDKVTAIRQQMMIQHVQTFKGDTYVDRSSKNYIPNQVQLLAQKQIQIQKHYATTSNPELTLSHFLGTAFISFQFEQFKDYFVQQHSQNLKLLYDDQSSMQISLAPPVEEINWFRLNSNTQQIKMTILKCSLLVIIVIAIFLTLFWWIEYWRMASGFGIIKFGNIRRFQVTKSGVLYILVVSILLKIFTLVISKIIQYFTESAAFRTKNSQFIAKTTQKIYFHFLFIAIAFIFVSQYWSGKAKSWDEVSVTITLLITKSLVMRTIINFICFDRLKQLIKQKCCYNEETTSIFQIQLNKLRQLPIFDVSERLIFYAVWMLVVSLFYSIASITCLVLIGIFLLNYWIDKWNLLRRCSNPISINTDIGLVMLRLMQFEILVFALGNFLTMHLVDLPHLQSRNQESYLSRALHLHLDYKQTATLGLIIGALFLLITHFMPSNFWRDYKSKRKTFSEAVHMFRNTYWNSNPATRFAQEDQYERAKNTTKQVPFTLANFKNFSLPISSMSRQVQQQIPEKSKQKISNMKEEINKQQLNLNFQEISLGKTYNISQNSGNRSTRRKKPN